MFCTCALTIPHWGGHLWEWGCSSVVERLLCMQKVLGSKPSISNQHFFFILLKIYWSGHQDSFYWVGYTHVHKVHVHVHVCVYEKKSSHRLLLLKLPCKSTASITQFSCVYVESCCVLSLCRKSKPQIFFGTRTHKQITQITHEMAKTAYSETPWAFTSLWCHTCMYMHVYESITSRYIYMLWHTVQITANLTNECK